MMHSTPGKIAQISALIITFVSTLVFAIILLLFYDLAFIPFILFVPLVFLSTYLTIKYALEKFIYEKIKIIYKTIGRKPISQKKKKKGKKTNDDILEIVNQVVLEWSKEKEKEIKALKKMETYRREFIGNVSHELKTPIFNIQGYVLTLLDGGLKDDSINTKFLKKSEKSVNRMIAIVEDLEDISKLEVGELKLKKESFDIVQLTREVIDFLEMKVGSYNASIHLKVTPSKVLMVEGDKKRIRQVLINLLDNAIKYGDADNGVVNISIYDFHDKFLYEVSDNGIGIPEDNLYRIFERFYRTDESRSRKNGGTGLGLAIVKHILEAHHQTISVRSKEGKGTTFSFTLLKG